MKNRTSLIIAHRLSTIIDADNIILLNDGKIENIGTHKFLLKNSSIYKNLYQLQFKKKIMVKKILKKKRFQYFLGWLISIYLKFCYHSSIWYIKNNQNIKELISKKKSFLVCFWHNRILIKAPFCWEDQEKKI